jgi:hypothetical protein
MPQRDLHEGFRDPRRAPAGELVEFLEAADRLPGIRAVQRALRRALDPHPGMRLLGTSPTATSTARSTGS